MTDQTKNDPRTYGIIGAAMEVHRLLGCGFLEPVYQEALAVEFAKRKILYRRETSFPVFYKEVKLNIPYRPDFVCFDNVVVELKALARISGIEQSQVLSESPWVRNRSSAKLRRSLTRVSSLCLDPLVISVLNCPALNLRNLRIVPIQARKD